MYHESGLPANKINKSIDFHNSNRNQPDAAAASRDSRLLLVRDQQPARIGSCARAEPPSDGDEQGTELPIVYAGSLGLRNNLFYRDDSYEDEEVEEEDSARRKQISNRFGKQQQQSINRNHHNSHSNKSSAAVNTNTSNDTRGAPEPDNRHFPPDYFSNTLESKSYSLINRYTLNLLL